MINNMMNIVLVLIDGCADGLLNLASIISFNDLGCVSNTVSEFILLCF